MRPMYVRADFHATYTFEPLSSALRILTSAMVEPRPPLHSYPDLLNDP